MIDDTANAIGAAIKFAHENLKGDDHIEISFGKYGYEVVLCCDDEDTPHYTNGSSIVDDILECVKRSSGGKDK